MKFHNLKTWPECYHFVLSGEKTFDVRKNDRNFEVDDFLVLEEYLPKVGHFTGRKLVRRITYILKGPGFGIEDGFCVLGIKSQGEKD